MPADVLRLEEATHAHAHALAPHMRPEDAAEVQASGGYTPLEALVASIECSAVAYAAFANEELLGLCGFMPVADGSQAVVWALTSTAVERHRKSFWRLSRFMVAALASAYPVLTNFVDARHTASLRWLTRLGFTVLPAAPYGVHGLPFHQVVYRV